ncbi:uncharacterized protein LOC131221409 [Magnolia sinica]|uniref:uncharacterized protein LOC131221409 n=1 Tax=Magnolia sinica TaxID=86752 RepID=UPI002658F697|nr:uncharacterized protein LOC131221409 [Magnolia sinica]
MYAEKRHAKAARIREKYPERIPLEKHRRADQELKKRVLKLVFCLQEARSQTWKLQRVCEITVKIAFSDDKDCLVVVVCPFSLDGIRFELVVQGIHELESMSPPTTLHCTI